MGSDDEDEDAWDEEGMQAKNKPEASQQAEAKEPKKAEKTEKEHLTEKDTPCHPDSGSSSAPAEAATVETSQKAQPRTVVAFDAA